MSGFVDVNLNPLNQYLSYTHDGIQYPSNIFNMWDENQLSSIGIYKVVFQEVEIPEGKMVSKYNYKIEGNVAIATPILVDQPIFVPQSCTRAQGKAALLIAGLLDSVNEYIDSLIGEERFIANLAFNEANEWTRGSPFLNKAAAAIGLSDAQLDELFISASKITL